MLDKFTIDNFGLFVLYNFVAILVISVIYFFTKEFYRVKGNNPSKIGRVIVGAGLGISVLIVYLFINFAVDLGGYIDAIPKDWGPYINNPEVGYVYPTTLLTPAIIYLIVLPIMIDKKLVLPITIFILIGIFIKIPMNDPEFLERPEYWSILPMALFSTVIFSLIIYFFDKTNLFKNNGIKIIILLAIWLVITLILRIVQSTILLNSDMSDIQYLISYEFRLWGIELAYLSLILITQAVFIIIIERAYDNFNKLETFSTQDDVSYYKISLAQNKLKTLIDDNKINTGALVLIDIEAEDKDSISKVLLEIKSRIEWDYEKPFFFKATSIYYGIFIPINDINISTLMKNNKSTERDESDVLYKLEKTLHSAETNFNAEIKAAVSLYGVHSYDISELVEYSRFLLTPVVRRSNSNSIIVYDFKRVKSRLAERSDVMNLPIDINTLNISYLKGIDEEFIYYPSISFELDGKRSDLTKISNGNLTKQNIEFIIRYVSYQSLRRFNIKKSSLIVYYPSSYISSIEFNSSDFKKKLERYLNSKNVIIGLYMNGEKSKKIFLENLASLREDGYRFAIVNPMEIGQEKHDLVNPEFLIDLEEQLNPLKITKKKLEFKSDATRLNSNLV